MTEYVQLPCPSLTKVSIHSKPPRPGLSKLYNSSTRLHDVTIVEEDSQDSHHDVSVQEGEGGVLVCSEEDLLYTPYKTTTALYNHLIIKTTDVRFD